MRNVEFNVTGDQKDIIIKTERGVHLFDTKDTETIKFVLGIWESRFPSSYARLRQVYGNHKDWRFLAARRCIKCNFGADDHVKDIDEYGNINTEFVTCPLRGECPDEGLICMPTEETDLTDREIEIIKLIAKPLKSEDIAKTLFISIHTVNNHRKNIMRKLNISHPGEIINYAHKHYNL